MTQWIERPVMLAGESGKWRVMGQVPTKNAALAITPIEGLGFRITHVGSGRALWPNTWPLLEARRVCSRLLAIKGWDGEWEHVCKDQRLRAAAERVARQEGV